MSNGLEERSDNENESEQSEPVTRLPESGLRVTETDLVYERGREVLSAWPLAETHELVIGKQLHPFAACLLGSAAAILYIQWSFDLGWMLSVILYLFIGLLILFSLLNLTRPTLGFLYQGKLIRIACEESVEEVIAFTQSITSRKEALRAK